MTDEHHITIQEIKNVAETLNGLAIMEAICTHPQCSLVVHDVIIKGQEATGKDTDYLLDCLTCAIDCIHQIYKGLPEKLKAELIIDPDREGPQSDDEKDKGTTHDGK